MIPDHATLVVAKDDEKTALRLLSAVVIGWDSIPVAVRGRLIQDSCLIDGDGTALSFPAGVLAFIAKHKDRPL